MIPPEALPDFQKYQISQKMTWGHVLKDKFFQRGAGSKNDHSRRHPSPPRQGVYGLLIFGLFISLAAGTPTQVTAKTEITVCASGCDYTGISEAINAAETDDVIKIATGEYSTTATIAKSLTLRGGYNADFSVWDPTLYPTKLNANGAGRVIYASGAINLTLRGLILLNGYAQDSGAGVYGNGVTLWVLNSVIENNRVSANFHGNYGVGVHLSSGSLYMEDSVVQGNEPLPGGDSSHDGGGLYAGNAVVEIHDSQFLNNTAAFGTKSCGTGGGIRLENCTALLQRVTFRNNAATACNNGGGGLWTRIGSLRLLDSTFEGNTNGGAVVQTAGALIEGNTFTGNTGNGLVVSSWGDPVVNITVAHNLMRDNTGYGMIVPARAVSLIVDGNDFIGNGSGGLKLTTKSDTGAATAVIVRNNLFQANTTTFNGGGAHLIGAVDVLSNRFLHNHADGKGGGVYQSEYCSGSGSSTCQDNASAVYDGNLFRGNSAAEGGGLYSFPKYSTNLNITYRNMAFLDNTATGTGSAIYFYRYPKTPVTFAHLTVANNTGGDGAMIYHMMGSATYSNTILYKGDIGIKMHSPSVTLDHVLRHDILTPTVAETTGGLTDLSPITGSPAFAADGYHLTRSSAAVDAGVDLGIISDIDKNPRPMGTAPDLGADESPYAVSSSGVTATMLASNPSWKIYYTGVNVPPSTYLEQNYLLPYAYFAGQDASAIESYTITNDFPSELDLAEVTSPENMTYSRSGNVLTWVSQQALQPNGVNWIGLKGISQSVTGGQKMTSSGQMDYTLVGGQSGQIPFSVESQIPDRPVFPPVLTTPENGEVCAEEGGTLTAKGVAGAGMTVKIYENGVVKNSTVAAANGEFSLNWVTGLTEDHPINIYAIACDSSDTCSPPSRTVHLAPAENNWCPQRSYWEGDVSSKHHIFYFRNDAGRFASNDFVIPGVYGFHNTKVHLYSCCDDQSANPFRVKADGTVYTAPSAHDGRWWTFDITGGAHRVTIESQCGGIGSSSKPLKVTSGEILIDPDGFIFNSAKGGAYDSLTGAYQAVEPLEGMTITAYGYVPEWESWIQWPAHLYNSQINPQVTGADGYFAFFTPPGKYYLEVTGANGYQTWRSPVVEVVNEIVHVNIPLTSAAAQTGKQVLLTAAGPQPAVVTIPVDGRITWLSAMEEDATAQNLADLNENPVSQPRSNVLDPFLSVLGFDGGTLRPGETYTRVFPTCGEYTYSDGRGHIGTIKVVPVQGDIRGTGTPALADAIIAIQILSRMHPGGIRPDYAASGTDVDGDNRIGLAEVIFILQRITEP